MRSAPLPDPAPLPPQPQTADYPHAPRIMLEAIKRVVVEDDAGLFLIAFRDRRVAEQDTEDVNFGVVYYFHSAKWIQRFKAYFKWVKKTLTTQAPTGSTAGQLHDKR